ncbi:CerR family C-terminal domain-containing protein [Luteolibacter flavescens]|uniref:CerR family C-terminal domain-containing protein n=1 Tax=Luteolibacter flavescens TaxID=1859460 RepID=A0ABT3FVH3_9BACT|nr:CerR family C-terminal domain-containing protein [Luteolibacter flavescens]MCW1887591.1 CerR family C-terminal domain-containing protein [Luteolibacter flavescens]
MQRELFPTSPNKGEQARRKLLLAALKKVGEKGYENASVREIADDAGQNVASIAYYFGNKEKLYAAVLEGIGVYLAGIFSGLAEETRAKLESGTLDPQSATNVMKQLLRTLLGQQLEGGEFDKIRLVMIREQSSPSESFDLLYKKTLKPLHELFTNVLGVATGEDPASTITILRGHALFGQVLAFTVARTTILRRLGVKKLTRDHLATIGDIIDEHLDIICPGLKGAIP